MQLIVHRTQLIVHHMQLIILSSSYIYAAHRTQLIVRSSSYIIRSSSYIIRSSSYTARRMQLIVRSSAYAAHCTQLIVHHTQLIVRSSSYIIRSSSYTAHRTQLIVHRTQLIVHSSSYIVCSSSYIIRSSSYAAHRTHLIVRSSSYIIRSSSYAAHRTSYAAHRTSYAAYRTSYAAHHTQLIVHHTQLIVHHTQLIVHSSVRSSSYIIRSSSYTARRTQLIVRSSAYAAHRTQLIVYRTQLIVHHTQLIVHHTQLIVRSSSYIIRSSSYTAHHTQLIVHHTQLIVQSTQLIVHHTQLIVHRTQLIVHHTQLIVHSSSYAAHRTSYAAHRTQLIVHHTQLIVHHTQLIVRSSAYTLIVRSSSYIIRSSSYIVRRSSYAAYCTQIIIRSLLYADHSTSCDSLTCVTDYLEHISCTWRVSVPPEPGMSYHLTAASPDEEISCNLAVTSCSDGAGDLTEYTCKLHEESGITMQNYTISIRTKSRGHETNIDTCPYFDTAQNIKLLAPFNLTVSHAAPCGMYNFTWQIAYDEMSYIEDFDYELRFKRTPDSWEPKKVKRLTNNQQLLQLVASELVSGTEHSAQVRTLPATGSGYTGTWSDWSPPITWSTARCDPDLDQIFQLPLLCALVSMLIVVVVIVTLNVPQRLWKKLWVMTPNPAPFFNPLFSDHGGNFTSWVNAQHPDALYEVNEKSAMVLEMGDLVQVYDGPIALEKALMGLKPWDKQSDIHSSWQALCGPTYCPSSQSRGQFGNIIQQWKDKSYGRVSIDTVTVSGEVGACCSQCSYRCRPPYLTQCKSQAGTDNPDEQDYPSSKQLLSHLQPVSTGAGQHDHSTTPLNMMSRLQSSDGHGGTSAHVLDLQCLNVVDWAAENEPFPLNDGEDASWDDGNVDEAGSWSDGSLDNISSCSRLEADPGYPKMSLDLDTVDSGFMEIDTDSMTTVDCGYKSNAGTEGVVRAEHGQEPSDSSPVHCEQEEQYYRSYVKQWAKSTPTCTDGSSHQ
uniref:interleukin-21 receptor-like n=1 Tax=Pristiophorus japonicus TaxID=55135 RepID=UPI00398F057C